MVHPTVCPAASFDPAADAKALRKAMKGMGTDEDTIIKILSNRTDQQRQAILHAYNRMDDDRNLVKDLKKELSGHFEDLVLALLTPLDEFLAQELHDAMARMGTNEGDLIEILCTRDNTSLHAIRQAYLRLYKKDLVKDIKSETSDDFKKLLVSLCACHREEGGARTDIALGLACKLYKAGEGRKGTDEDEIIRILTTYSYATLCVVFAEYRLQTGNTLREVMAQELEGDFKKAMLALYDSIYATPAYFAEALNKSMKGFGTSDKTLIRLIVSRCEIDMEDIKREYEKIYDKPLGKDIKGDTSGHYEDLLLALINYK
ncbi:hypothetical protein SK128_000747 [Halocaridina rubra]|uniref:Annexin n=1 Tax=Halocaridina rubra TaxID=373956 RepID=A0AAN8WYN4_HALRR